MPSSLPAHVPSYSARLAVPFLTYAQQRPQLAAIWSAPPEWDPDGRMPISLAHHLLEKAVAISGDADLGLKVGQIMAPGDLPALDYAMSTSATVQDAVDVGTRYMRLVNDALVLKLEPRETRTVLRLESHASMPRSASDFQMSSFYSVHIRIWLAAEPKLSCWFMHAAPSDLTEYRRVFGAAELVFSAPCNGFCFATELLRAPLPSADARLNPVVRKYTELMFEQLPTDLGLSPQVRDLVSRELAHGQPDASKVARQLGMSRRTLTRRLSQEGTNFVAMVDDVRRSLAFRHLARRELAVSEVAYLLGFGDVTAFHRAFKRWTKQTPGDYRRKVNDS